MTAKCQHCGAPLFRKVGDRYKLRVHSRVLAFNADGTAEMVCPECGKDTSVPVRYEPEPEAPAPVIIRLSDTTIRRIRTAAI
jgi:uncharacterized Zn finger protein (UPF0148 family)